MCNAGCNVHFEASEGLIYYRGRIIPRGPCNYKNNLWQLNLPTPSTTNTVVTAKGADKFTKEGAIAAPTQYKNNIVKTKNNIFTFNAYQ